MMTTIVKVIILIFLAFILYALASAFYFLIVDKGRGTRSVKALTWRIGLSLVLFILLMFAMFMGWITPHHLMRV